MLSNGKVKEAHIAVRNALAESPGDPHLALLRGQIALAEGNADLAITTLKRLLDHAELGAAARENLARAQLMSGQGKRALETLGNGADATALAFAVRVGAHTQGGDFDAAGQFLTQGLAKFPDSADLLVLAGDRELAIGDLAKARGYSARALKTGPKDAQAFLLAGRIAMIERKFAEAEQHFDAVLALRPNFQTALLAKAAIALDRGEKDEARAILEKASNQLGGSAPAISYYQAQMAFDAGKIEEANRILQSMGDVSAFPPATMLAGLVAAKRGQPEQAITLLRRFLDRGGEDGRARLAYALALAEVGAQGDAYAAIRPLADAANAPAQVLDVAAKLAARSDPAKAQAYRARIGKLKAEAGIAPQMASADKAIRAGDWKAADGIYGQLLRDNPQTDNVVLLNNAAFARLELGDAKSAVALGRRALALAPNDPTVLDTVGWALYKADGPSPEAVALLRRAVSAMPENANIRRHANVVAREMQGGAGV